VTRRRPLHSGQRVRFTLSKGERDLLLRHALLSDELERRLRFAITTAGSRLAADVTLDEVDDLASSVAAEANHCEEPEVKGRKLLSIKGVIYCCRGGNQAQSAKEDADCAPMNAT
jgi:hypothetical protein